MRIIHTCLRYPPAIGGVETYVKDIVEQTRSINSNRDVRVLTSNMSSHGPITELNPTDLLDDPPYIQRLHHLSTPLVSYPRLQALGYYLGHHKPNLIHAYSFWYQPADVASRYAHKNKVPFIFHPIFYQNKIRQKLKWKLYKKIIGAKTFRYADVVAVISPYEKELITKAKLPVKRFELIPPGINLSDFERVRINPYLKRKITGPVILSVGRLTKSKSIDTVIRLMPHLISEFPDLQYAIAGADFGYKANLKKLINRLNLNRHVHILGKLSRDELIGAYQHASLLAHPSTYEAFGIVLAESLAAQTPVVARNIASIPFVAPHHKAGLLFRRDQELYACLKELLSNKNLRNSLAHQGQQYVTGNFSWKIVKEKLVKLYAEFDQ